VTFSCALAVAAIATSTRRRTSKRSDMAFLYNSGRIKKKISESAQAVGNTGLEDDDKAIAK
jgi:hypothetical protein